METVHEDEVIEKTEMVSEEEDSLLCEGRYVVSVLCHWKEINSLGEEGRNRERPLDERELFTHLEFRRKPMQTPSGRSRTDTFCSPDGERASCCNTDHHFSATTIFEPKD